MRAIIAGLLLASVATAGEVPTKPNEKQSTDRERLQGEWVVVEVETADGISTHSPYDKERGTTVFFEGDTVRMLEGSKVLEAWSNATFTLGSTASPKTIDLDGTKGKTKMLRTGIYSFDGDNLVVYLGTARPKDISASPSKLTGEVVLRLKRPML